jgi:hypothetical protein
MKTKEEKLEDKNEWQSLLYMGEMETDRVSCTCTWGELRDGAATGPPAEEKRIF